MGRDDDTVHLDDDERDPFARDLAGMDAAAHEVLDELGLALDPVVPAPAIREKLMSTLATGAGRLHRFAGAVSRLLDLPIARAKTLLDAVDGDAGWESGPVPGMLVMHLPKGPSVAQAIVGFVRLPPGAGFPEHTHLGEETVFVLQGAYQDSNGAVRNPGTAATMTENTTHAFRVLDGPDLVYLLVLFGGVQIGDELIRPGDRRL